MQLAGTKQLLSRYLSQLLLRKPSSATILPISLRSCEDRKLGRSCLCC